MAIYGYTKNYKLIKPQFNTDTWHDYIYDNLDTIDAVMSAIYASGNWKGFWATNTAYTVGDVVIDQDTDTMYKVMVDHTTSEATFAEEFTAHPTYYELWSPNNLAEDWAIKMNGEVSNVDYSSKAYAISSALIDSGSAKEWAINSGTIGTTGEYSAKKYATDAHNDYISMTTDANVVAVGTNIANVNTVSLNISDVNTTASNISSVNTVAGDISRVGLVADDISSVHTVAVDISNVIDVAANKTNIDTVAGDKTNIDKVASDITSVRVTSNYINDVTTVAFDITNVNTVAGISTDVTTVSSIATAVSTVSGIESEVLDVSDNRTDISTVAGISADVTTVAGVSSYMATVAGLDTEIAAVAGNVTNINAVAAIDSDVTTVAGISANVSTVAGNNANVTTVATNISDVNTAVANMAAIQAAPTAASNAATSANNSQVWAEGTDEQVQALGGTHSSKVWAEQSTNANVDLSNLSATGNDKFVTKNTNQTISGVKTFMAGVLQTNTPLLLKQSNTTEGGQIDFERGGSSVLSSNPYIDLNTNTIRVIGTSSQNTLHIPLQVDLENNQVLVPTPAANANDYQAANTYWCKAYIGAVDYSAGTDVTSSVFAASGTGYKPTKKGVLLIKTLNTSGGTCDIYIYNSSGTLQVQKQFNTAGSTYTMSGGTCELLLDSNYSVRVSNTQYGTAGTQFWAYFFPYA